MDGSMLCKFDEKECSSDNPTYVERNLVHVATHIEIEIEKETKYDENFMSKDELITVKK